MPSLTARTSVKSASFILLQGVPTHISLEAVRASINEVEGVSSLHEVGLAWLNRLFRR